MITRIEALGFRCLEDVDQEVAPFHVLVGPNGSGKSSFLDVVGFLGDLLAVGPLGALIGDAPARIQQRAADPQHICWMRNRTRFELAVELAIPEDRAKALGNGRRFERARYEVAIDIDHAEAGPRGVGIVGETLWLRSQDSAKPAKQRSLFPESRPARPAILREPKKQSPKGWKKVINKIVGSNDYFFSETTGWQNPFKLGPNKSALANLPADEEKFPVATWVKDVLGEGIQRIELNAERMRAPSPPGLASTFMPDGSNLPLSVETLHRLAPDRYRRWIDHLQTALPDLVDIETVERHDDRHRYLMARFRSGLEAPSWSLSDGTLRLFALTLLAYLPVRNRIYLIEEPENGIHPRAVETVYQSLSSVYESQVLCATHSPVVLGMAEPDDVLCFAKAGSGATAIVRGSEHPRLREWKGALNLGTLFASGVLG